MAHEDAPNIPSEDWLQILGIESLCQGDVLVFLYRHQTSLANAEHIARLLGYETNPVIAALERLEALGFVNRSRANRGARLYQFVAPADPSRGEPLGRLMTLLDSRAGRLLVARQLQRDGPSPPRSEQPLLHMEVGGTWLKAI